jgi:iron complex outermembrane receptor protein
LGLSNGRDRPVGNLNYAISDASGPFNLSLPVSLFEWDRQVRNLVERQMSGTDGKAALSEQLGTNTSWGWGYNVAPRVNFKISDEQTMSLATFFQKGYWNYTTDFANRTLTGHPVFDDNAIQAGFWENRRGNLTWIHRFSEDQRIEIKAGVQQFRSGFDLNNVRANITQLKTTGNNQDDAYTQAGKYSQLLGNEHTLTAGWDLETRERQERRTTTDGSGIALLPAFEGQPFEAQMRRQAFYIQDEWEISPQWQLYFGLRNERIASESITTLTPVVNVSSVLSPLAHMTYKFDPKSKDMVRASLTRSYKAPGLNAMLARPVVSAAYTNLTQTNTYLSPDRLGNPALTPELATGLDIAYENYLSNDGIFSVGLFHRNLSNVVRNITELRQVSWASVPRWITQPQNFSDAVTRGVEFELRGRAADLMPQLFNTNKGLNLRGSLSIYSSRIAALTGPNNRLDGQQPWSANLGFDQRISGMPLTVGGNLSLTPGYITRQTADQWLTRSVSRGIDLFATMPVSPTMMFRAAASAGVQQFGPPNGTTLTTLANGDYTLTDRYAKPQLNLSLDIRL